METRTSFPFIVKISSLANGRRFIKPVAFFLVIALSVIITWEPMFQNSLVNSDIENHEPAFIHERSRGDPPMSAAVTPREGTNRTKFNFTLTIADAAYVSSVRLKIAELAYIDILVSTVSGSNTTYWYNGSFPDLAPDTYAFSFEIDTFTDNYSCTGGELVFIIMFSPILSYSVTPPSGLEGTVFTFNMRYRDPGGEPPSYVVVVIDNTTHYEMIKATYPENFSKGVNYSTNSLGMKLGPGTHTYYPVVTLNETMYFDRHGFKTFVVLQDRKETGEEKWYEDQCCLFPLIFMVMLLLFSIINNRVMRSRMKKRKTAAPGPFGGARELGGDRCSNCNSPVSDDDTFCPHCGEYFEDETVCPKCGNVVLDEDAACEKCGFTVEGIDINENIRNREKWKDDVRKTSRASNRVPLVVKGTARTDAVNDEQGFICSICGAEVMGSALKCNECGTELE